MDPDFIYVVIIGTGLPVVLVMPWWVQLIWCVAATCAMVGVETAAREQKR